jgi:5-methyltetrahydrofolate--homocysteine methyltransferase
VEQALETLYASVISGRKDDVEAGVRSALESGVSVERILSEGLIAAMTDVGRRFECGDFFVPEMLVAARAMQAGLTILRPKLVDRGVPMAGKVLIGTVKGDMHDIGKNLVAMMLEGAGYLIVDLGTDVSPGKFVASVEQSKPDIVALSALLTTTMPAMKATIDALSEAGLREQAKVIVGGAPITESYAQKIGADGFAPDASRAVGLARTLA